MLKLQYFGHLMGYTPDAWGQKKGMTEDEMVGWYHWLNGYEFPQAPGDSEGQSLLQFMVSQSQTWLSDSTTTINLKITRIFSALNIILNLVHIHLHFLFGEWGHTHLYTPLAGPQQALHECHVNAQEGQEITSTWYFSCNSETISFPRAETLS